MSLNTKFTTCCKFCMFTHRVNSKFTTRQIYYHPVKCKLKSNKKDNINKEEFSQCHRILRDMVPVVFPYIRLILQHEDWHAMQWSVPAASNLYRKSSLPQIYHSVGDKEKNHLMIPNVMHRWFHCIANLSLWPDQRKLDLNHWKN